MKTGNLMVSISVAVTFSMALTVVRGDDVNDLVDTILQASPKERAKASSYKSSIHSSKPSIKEVHSNPYGISESQLVEASAKFPPDIVGKYIYGKVYFYSITQYEGETYILLGTPNNRRLRLFTSDPQVLAAFNLPWNTQFYIPKETPLRVVAKYLPGFYNVRMPWDAVNTSHSVQEVLTRDANDMQSSLNELGRTLKGGMPRPRQQ